MIFLILLNTFSIWLICSYLKNFSIFFILFFALIILNSEFLSFFSLFNSKNILILSILETTILYLIFYKTKTKFYFPNIKEEIQKIKNAFKLDIVLKYTFFVFLFMLFCFFILALHTPPLEPDSRMYHFVRIFHYIKQQSFFHFDTSQIRNIIMPINSEIIYSYFYLFKKNALNADIGFGLLSYFSFINAIFQIYLILRHLKFSIRKTLFTIFSLSSMGAILVQIPSLQTDIVVASLILSSLYLLLKNRISNACLFLSSLSYALAIGVKTTAIIIFPAYLVFLFYVIRNKKSIFKYFLFFLFNFLIFSSYNYILNFIQFHDFISPFSLKAEHSLYNQKEAISNIVVFLKDFLGHKLLILFNIPQNHITNVPYDERTVGFSFLGCFVFIPAIFYSIFKGIKTKNKNIKLISLFSSLFILNFLIICFNFTYSPYIVRYFVTFVMLSGFCLVYFYKLKIIKNIILAFCILEMLFYSIYSSRYPIHYFIKGFDKKTIMLKKQKDISIYVQYKFLEIFKNTFKKEDKIAIINDDDFYEIKQLMTQGYNINILTLDKINKNSLNDYDFLIFEYYSETNNNDEYLKMEEKNFKCEYTMKFYNKKLTPLSKKCYFDERFLNNYNFNFYKKINIENKNFYIYKNSK